MLGGFERDRGLSHYNCFEFLHARLKNAFDLSCNRRGHENRIKIIFTALGKDKYVSTSLITLRLFQLDTDEGMQDLRETSVRV